MPRERTHTFWVNKVWEYGRNRRELKPPAINRELQKLLDKGQLQAPPGYEAVPSAKTIGRLLKELQLEPEEKQKVYDWCKWPESFMEGRIPWEASRAALDLMDLTITRDHVRPTVLQATWFWRVTLAAPDMPVLQRLELAVHFAEPDYLKLDALVRHSEQHLAQRLWIPRPPAPINYDGPPLKCHVCGQVPGQVFEGFKCESCGGPLVLVDQQQQEQRENKWEASTNESGKIKTASSTKAKRGGSNITRTESRSAKAPKPQRKPKPKRR